MSTREVVKSYYESQSRKDDQACSVISYTYVNPKGEKLNQEVAEISEVKDCKLARVTIYFDLTAYRSFMRG